MTTKYMEVQKEAARLPFQERAMLAQELLQSLDELPAEENAKIWIEESKRRLAAMEDGRLELIDEETAFERAFQALNEKNQV